MCLTHVISLSTTEDLCVLLCYVSPSFSWSLVEVSPARGKEIDAKHDGGEEDGREDVSETCRGLVSMVGESVPPEGRTDDTAPCRRTENYQRHDTPPRRDGHLDPPGDWLAAVVPPFTDHLRGTRIHVRRVRDLHTLPQQTHCFSRGF